jgi:phosphopantetheinyl transferase
MSRRPMIGRIIRQDPGQTLVMRREIDLREDLFARDHTLGGRDASAIDAGHHGLAVMPMAFSLEMMAEAASLLVPGRLVVGLRQVRLNRWIPLFDEPVTLEVAARVTEPAAPGGGPQGTAEVVIEIRDLGNANQSGRWENPSVEGTVVLADRYPSPPPAEDFPLTNDRRCPLGPDELYHTERRLFHGPLFRAVCSTGRMGDEGIEGQLATLSDAGLFRSTPRPDLLLNPLLIDASTHILVCWHLSQPDQAGRVVFPYELGTVQIFGPRPAEGTRMGCQVTVKQSSTRQVSHRIDLFGPDEVLWCRMDPAEYWRFYWPPQYVAFFRHHDRQLVCQEWPEAVPAGDHLEGNAGMAPAAGVCCMKAAPPYDIVQPVVRSALARVSLGPAEWQEFYRLKAVEKRRTEWLFGRIAAKDCVRSLLQHRYGQQLFPADMEIVADQHGQPTIRLRSSHTVEMPHVSISHTQGLVAALAAFGHRVGIDLERIEPRDRKFEEIAFDPQELVLLDDFGTDRDEGITRFWCAKEAVGKALGRGLAEGRATAIVRRFDRATGIAHLALGPLLAAEYPELASLELVAWTRRENDLVVATTLAEEDSRS